MKKMIFNFFEKNNLLASSKSLFCYWRPAKNTFLNFPKACLTSIQTLDRLFQVLNTSPVTAYIVFESLSQNCIPATTTAAAATVIKSLIESATAS